MHSEEKVELPFDPNKAGFELADFRPVAYYDKHMDCIRVHTHDRSITEIRLSEYFTIYRCNNRTLMDPEYVGFTIKGVRHLFDDIGLGLSGAHKLAEIIEGIVTKMPGEIAELLKLIYERHKSVGELVISFSDENDNNGGDHHRSHVAA